MNQPKFPAGERRNLSDPKKISSVLQREVKRALVQPRVANHLSAHAGAEKSFEHILLEPANDRIRSSKFMIGE